ncbi:MAG: crotonase/enoyl-CoA hydratase family protein [Pseudomonadota bacterium]
MYRTIEIAQDSSGVATLTLNRPEKRNAMSGEMISELTAASRRLGTDDTIRAVILAANGEVFCAGGDLSWMQTMMAADAPTRHEEAMKLAKMLHALNTMPVPMIGKVQGNAFGGGVGLMSVCDMVIADKTAQFGLTETKLGLIPATIGPYVIARMGEAKARSVFMSSQIFSSDEAVRLGLVSHAVTKTKLNSAVQAQIEPYLACAPGAVAEAKALARAFGPVIDANAIDQTVDALVKRWDSDEAAEGIAAFFEKRKPHWQD